MTRTSNSKSNRLGSAKLGNAKGKTRK
jgi:hypothetical protein